MLRQCYGKNFSHPVFRLDLSDTEEAVRTIKQFNPEVIIGGPPCQDFSHAGKRVETGRAVLTESYAKIVKTIKSPYFVMENVDRDANSAAFANARTVFKEAGYGITQITLDASLYGVLQKRKRFCRIGTSNKLDDFVRRYFEDGISDKETTWRDYFGETLDFEFYYRHPRNYSRSAIFLLTSRHLPCGELTALFLKVTLDTQTTLAR